jgi:hypothetical protein
MKMEPYHHGSIEFGFQIGWKWGNPLTHANVCRDAIGLDLIASPSERSITK